MRKRERPYFISYGGKRQPLADWARELGVPHSTLYGRMRAGMSDEEIINGPKKLTIEVDGVSRSVHEWAKVANVPASTIYGRLREGVDGREAIYGKG